MKIIISLVLIFALSFSLIGYGEEQITNNPPANGTQGGANMESIWNLTDTNEFVIAMTEHLAEKTHYGEDLSVLSEAERIFYITQALEMEVNNGGFSQFFFNSSGDFSNELVDAFTAIGAIKTVAICQKAIDAFGRDIPVDRYERQEMLAELESDELDAILGECDDAFYAYEEDLNELNYAFVMKNKEQFT